MTRDASTPDVPGSGTPTLVLRLSLPATDDFRAVAADVAVRIAEYVGTPEDIAKSTGETIHALAADVLPERGTDRDITFEFHQIEDELRIDARCGDRASSASHPLAT